MRIAAIVLAVFILFFGLRMILIAFQTALRGKVLVRQGFRTHWQPLPDPGEALKIAFRDAILGLLMIVLAFVMLF
jgi:hypothetical protein